jgi:uncharacterized membrane protein
MPTNKKKAVKKLQSVFMRGLLFALPIGVTIFVVSFIWGLADSWLGPGVALIVKTLLPDAWLVGPLAGGNIPGLSLILLIALMFVLGWIASWPVGKKGLLLIDYVFHAIPGVRGIYSTVRKVVEAIGDPDKPRFQKVVFLDFPSASTRSIGFVTATVVDNADGEIWLTVFVPTVPNVTSGFTMVVREKDTVNAGLTPEEGLKLVVSLGVLTPANLPITGQAPQTTDEGSNS